MQKLLSFGLPLFAILLLASCNTAEKYQKNQAATSAWLGQFNAPARVNLQGNWTSPEWGSAIFKQTGRTITGQMGQYQARGVVSGSTAFLALEDGGWTYYTAILKSTGSSKLAGTYSSSVPYSEQESRVVFLERF